MITFAKVKALTESRISGSGVDAARHASKYITPYLPGGEKHAEGTHKLGVSTNGMEAGTALTIHGHHVDNSGTHHVTVSKQGSSDKVTLPASKLTKPTGATKVENKGHQYEKQFFEHAKKHGLVPEGHKPAGSTAGTDFPILNKKKNTTHSGTVSSEDRVMHGEAKAGLTAAFGQLTIKHTPEKGWHIPDEARAKRPEYANEIEKAGIIEHMNKHHDPDKHEIKTTASGRAKSIQMDHPNLNPAKAYLKDHHVHVLQVGGGYGTYRVGEKDHTGHGLPELSGKGKWTVREKQFGNKRARTVMFQPAGKSGLNKSHVNLEKDEDMQKFKKTLGHE